MSSTTLSLDDRRRFGALVAQAWSDPQVEARYRVEPHAVLAEHRINVAAGSPAPAMPARPMDEIRDEDLVLVAAGDDAAVVDFSTCGTASSFSCPGCTAATAGSGQTC